MLNKITDEVNEFLQNYEKRKVMNAFLNTINTSLRSIATCYVKLEIKNVLGIIYNFLLSLLPHLI